MPGRLTSGKTGVHLVTNLITSIHIMKRNFLAACLAFLVAFVYNYCLAQAPANFVFKNGENGYACFRIPAIIKSPNGNLLAFAEARKKDCDDFGDIDVVMKRSKNNGKHWSNLEVVADNNLVKAGNPAPVVDLLDPKFPGGRVFLLYNTASASEADSRNGVSTREIWYITSTDNGKSWNKPVNITTSVHKPFSPAFNPTYTFKEDWRTNALTPGHAFQFTTGEKEGRIFIPANHSVGAKKEKDDFDNYRAHSFFSDDHGSTWRLGADILIPGGNESTAAELSDGSVLQNVRYQSKTDRHRILAYSKNGGESWDTAYVSKDLPDPVCQGSMISLRNASRHVLLFSNPASQVKREKMTIRASMDNGKSWPFFYLVDPGPSSYSDLVGVKPNKIGLLYERGSNGGIAYTLLLLKKILGR